MTLQNQANYRSVHDMVRLSYTVGLMEHRRVLLIGDNFLLAKFLVESRARHVTAVAEQSPHTPWPGRKEAPGLDL